jgi:hypothetical protein
VVVCRIFFVQLEKETIIHAYILLAAFGGRLALKAFLLISIDSRKVAPTIQFLVDAVLEGMKNSL